MQAASFVRPEPPRSSSVDGEVRLVIAGVSWGRYVAIRELLEDHPGLRMSFLEGVLEIMSPSRRHEREKKLIARLIEAWALTRRARLDGYGSMTFRKEAAERGAEPDGCYVVRGDLGEAPDIAIEVVVTSGGIDKLAVYQGLGVPEVWFFRDGAFELHRLGDDGYARIERSTFLPELDLVQLATFVDRDDQTAAVLAYVDSLR
ncbi:MAG TPA: Uma2 family endonuclease [Kofleriaceae bacterium]|nr:Uma2 family endonuclease [Kofleriaceae bacterium]